MSKDIWHTSKEKPEQFRYYLEEYDRFSNGVGYLINKRYGGGNTIDDLTTKRWCYVDELLALETELERTHKALEQTTDVLEKEIKSGKEFAEYMRTRLCRAKKQLKDADIALEIVERDFGGTFSTDYRTLLRTIRDARERIQKELNNEE